MKILTGLFQILGLFAAVSVQARSDDISSLKTDYYNKDQYLAFYVVPLDAFGEISENCRDCKEIHQQVIQKLDEEFGSKGEGKIVFYTLDSKNPLVATGTETPFLQIVKNKKTLVIFRPGSVNKVQSLTSKADINLRDADEMSDALLELLSTGNLTTFQQLDVEFCRDTYKKLKESIENDVHNLGDKNLFATQEPSLKRSEKTTRLHKDLSERCTGDKRNLSEKEVRNLTARCKNHIDTFVINYILEIYSRAKKKVAVAEDKLKQWKSAEEKLLEKCF